MKKFVILFLLLTTLFTCALAQENDILLKYKQETISDFPEVYEIRKTLNKNRNYAYPECLTIKENFPEVYNNDMSNPIYIAHYIFQNLNIDYVSQKLFSSIVECLITYPKESYDGYYSKIYVAEFFSISHIICFSKNKDKILIDIYDEDKKDSIILTLNYVLDNIQVNYDIKSSTYDNKNKMSKEFMEAAWYSMWNYQRKQYPQNFTLNNNTSKLYSNILNELNKKTWKEFCSSYESIVFLEDIFEKEYFEPNFLERMVLVELIQRCLVSNM
ncbi:MAG: hypothetical protein IJD23_11165 [Spirochaetaceae bacterium]|nr:hypothetical protein [Spirochaetaceae bacterium]